MNKSSSSGKVIFSDKSVYVGELENEWPNGYGGWTHPNGEEYKGQWSDGKENGAGVYSYPDGGEFSGNFVDGLREGSGIWSHPDGSNYHGQWSKGKFHGKGIFIWSDQKKYEGDWKMEFKKELEKQIILMVENTWENIKMVKKMAVSYTHLRAHETP